jgi:energy-coupling factor transporter ATP-binding protein EcfA2
MAKAAKGEVTTSLEEWLGKQERWLQRAATEFVSARRAPDDTELAALADCCHQEALGLLTEACPPMVAGTLAAVATGGELRLASISNVHGVNALRSDASLNLDQGHVTVVYGTNGSGKTGYARLLKAMCGARAKEDRLYPNVYLSYNGEAQATLALSIDGQTRPPIAWKASEGPIAKLATAVHVFDTASANLFMEKSNQASHEPRSMRFVTGLIDISDRVAAELRRRRDDLTSKLPDLPVAHTNMVAGKFLRAIGPATTVEQIETACILPDGHAQEIADLDAALAETDLAGQLITFTASIQRNVEVRASLELLQSGLTDEIIDATKTLRETARTKRLAATAFAQKFFEGLPLAGVGESIWRELWAHAANYAEQVAYVGHTHPVVDDGARCVLCQQVLEPEAKARLSSFSTFLEDQSETDTLAAEAALTEAVSALVIRPDPTFWSLLEAATGLAGDPVHAVRNAVDDRFKALDGTGDGALLPPLDITLFLDALTTNGLRLGTERDNLAAVVTAQGRAEKRARLDELQAQVWLATTKDAMLDEVARFEAIKGLNDAVRLAGTHALTQKSTELGTLEVVGGYQNRFNAELTAIGGADLPIKLKAKPEGKGRFSFSLELNGVQIKAPLRAVLSEGEQRAIALASFLADITGSPRSTPVIFDDPISSLDQKFEEDVATRLVALSKYRQVIVFTHRLSLMTLLEGAATTANQFGGQIDVGIQVIARVQGKPGTPAPSNVFSQKPKAALNGLVQDVAGLAKVPVSLEFQARVGLCVNFRITLEKVIEVHLCADLVNRFRREITTKNKIGRLALVRVEDCAIIDELMTKYSGFVHSSSQETPPDVPEADVLLADITGLQAWLKEFEGRVVGE